MSGPGRGGPARGYRWADATPGNRIAEVHGAHSERRISPLAGEHKRGLLEGPDCPPYLLADTSYGPTIDQWAWTRAIVDLLRGYLDEHGIVAALTDLEEHEEREERAKDSTTRKGTSRRVRSALDELHRAETRLANLSGRLGLDPAGRAKIGRDLSAARWYGGPTALDRRLAEIEAERQAAAIEAGTDGHG